MTKEEIEQLIIDAKHQQKGFHRVAGKMSQQLIEALEQVKNIAYEPVLGVGVSNDAMGDAAKDFTDNNTDLTKLGIYTAYYNGARWMRDKMSDTNA